MRYRALILLLIMGCSMDLAPDNGKTEIIDRIFLVLDVFIGTILYTVKLSIVYFCYGLELYLELFCHMIHCLLVDICSDDMMHYYTCISDILQNLNKFVKNNINIWFLFFDFRPSYFHSFYRVWMREVVIRVTHIPHAVSYCYNTCDQTKSCSTSSHGGGKYSARKKRQTGAILVNSNILS